MFPIVAEMYGYVVGIDTHARNHVAVLVSKLGIVTAVREVRVTEKQMAGFVDWVLQQTGSNVLFAVEGTSSYGETLTALLLARHLPVTEVRPPKTKTRGANGKTDYIDAELAALHVLRLPVHTLATPRSGDVRRALRVLLGSRRQMVTQLTASKNTLTALLRGLSLGVDARTPLTWAQYQVMTAWRIRKDDRSASAIARAEAKRLAAQTISLTDALVANKQLLSELVNAIAPGLLDEPGVGPVTAAQVICSYSHKGRIRSAEAFAALAGTTPIPASSGNTVHYRLNRYGDRQLNHALHTIVMARMRSDEQTIRYTEKRTQLGMGTRDIKRALKRYVARSLFKKLETLNITA